jgi:hypothetical protein
MTIISYLTYLAADKSHQVAASNVATVKNVISLDIKDPKDHSKDELFINFDHINCANWKYITPRYSFEYKQDKLSGSIQLDETGLVGNGKVQVNGIEYPLNVNMAPSKYTIDQAFGDDCGAYMTADNIFMWDSNSEKWKNAVFTPDVYLFEYWFDDESSKASVRFTVSGKAWEPKKYIFVPTIGTERIQIEFKAGESPESAYLDYPLRQAFEMGLLGQTILGGANLYNELTYEGDCYGIKGKTLNPLKAVGTYHLSMDAGVLEVHAIALIINGLLAKNFTISGNKITWVASNETGHMPQSGFVEFSDDGDQIISSSHGFTGTRYYSI